MEEKREYQRFSITDRIFLKFESQPEKTIKGELFDISLGGLGIFLKENINLETIVQAIVQFDYLYSTEKQLVGRGKIIHASECELCGQEGFRIGIEFIEVNKEIVANIITKLQKAISREIRNKERL